MERRLFNRLARGSVFWAQATSTRKASHSKHTSIRSQEGDGLTRRAQRQFHNANKSHRARGWDLAHEQERGRSLVSVRTGETMNLAAVVVIDWRDEAGGAKSWGGETDGCTGGEGGSSWANCSDRRIGDKGRAAASRYPLE